MKLWEAMLLGVKYGPQLFEMLVDNKGGSCAIGAIYIGLANHPCEAWTGQRMALLTFPELRNESTCPVGDCRLFTINHTRVRESPKILLDVIIHLNNDHRWSRQRIAEWLANRELKFRPIMLVEKIKVKETV